MAQSAPRIKKKLVFLLIGFTTLFLLLVLRLVQIMIFRAPEWQLKAINQWTTRTQLTAQRGRIMDRSGLVLAQSGTSYRVLVNPQAIAEDERTRVALEVSDILGLDYDYVLERVSNTDRQQVQLKRKVESDVVARLTALQLGSGISFSTDMTRYYPMGQLFAQLIGFTGIDSEGQTGVEMEYDEYLAGEDGLMVMETDRNNQPLANVTPEYIAPTDGYDIVLTVDSVTQTYLEKALEECRTVNRAQTASGIVMNPKTGEILAISTYPSFDLNAPPRDDVTSLMAMSRNRMVTDTFEPGSIFKIITLAAALDSGAVTLDTKFECKGYETFRLEKVHCWNTRGHGTLTLTEAVEKSCNCAFMQMAAMMGVDTLYDYIYAFGFDVETECGIPSEDTGEVIHRKYIRDADLARIAFGQTVTVTGIQMASAACAAVNGGLLMQPYVLTSVTAGDGTVIEANEPKVLRRVIKEETSATVRQILQSVVDKGSGSNAKMTGYEVGGKTGTAQKYEEDGTVSRTKLIASFFGFLPTSDPELLCLLSVDEPAIPVVYGSTVAAPFVKKTFDDLVKYYGILPSVTTETETVPQVVGMTLADAEYALVRRGFTTTTLESEETGGAVVTLQVPAGDTEAPKGTIVVLYTTMTTFSDETIYKETATVPDLLGKRRQDAFDALYKLGLTMSYDKTACIGTVDSQSIAAGEVVEPGTNVHVTFVPTEDQLEAMAAGGTLPEDTGGGAGGAGGAGGGGGTGGPDDTDIPING